MTPAEYLAKKHIYDVALTTEQVDRLSREFREKSAWIVGQDEAYIIESYYNAAEKIASGELTPAEARRLVRELLAEAGYQAEDPGGWGDMKDGTARQKLILETNVNKAAGYAYYTSMQGSDAYPAQRLVRMGHRKQPRDWQARWMQAYATLPPEEQAKALPTQMVALMDCKIWEAISRWGDPYPPFDYGSGMDVDAVDYDTAARLGLVPKLEDEAILNRAEDCRSKDPAHCRVHGTPENHTAEAKSIEDKLSTIPPVEVTFTAEKKSGAEWAAGAQQYFMEHYAGRTFSIGETGHTLHVGSSKSRARLATKGANTQKRNESFKQLKNVIARAVHISSEEAKAKAGQGHHKADIMAKTATFEKYGAPASINGEKCLIWFNAQTKEKGAKDVLLYEFGVSPIK